MRSPYLVNSLLWLFIIAVAMSVGLYFGINAVFAFFIGANLASFSMFFIDKNAANATLGRVPEVNLYVALWFGMLGGLLGMSVMRHKTRKPGFQLIAMLMLLLQVALLAAVLRSAFV